MRGRNIPQFHSGGAGIGVATNFSNADLVAAASVTNQAGLQGWGWHVPSGGWAASIVEGGTGDFLSSTDITPTAVSGTALGNTFCNMNSQIGDYASWLIAKMLSGKPPVRLVVEMLARMQDSANGKVGLGTSNQAVARVGPSNAGANWALTTSIGATNFGTWDNLWHHWKFVLGPDINLYQDGDLVCARALSTDRFPCNIGTEIMTSNPTPELAWYDCRWES